MTRSVTTLAKDAAIAGLAGYVATRVMEPVSQKLYELESEQARKQEDQVRPGPPPEMAAKKTAALFGIELSGRQLQRGTMAFHYGLAISWAPLYQVPRRKTELGPRVYRFSTRTSPACHPSCDTISTSTGSTPSCCPSCSVGCECWEIRMPPIPETTDVGPLRNIGTGSGGEQAFVSAHDVVHLNTA